MPTSFSVLTWNVENLFPPGSFTGPSSANPITQDQFDGKLDFLSAFINGLDPMPDVIALQEIGGQTNDDTTSIDGLQVKLNGEYPHRAISSLPDNRRIKVVFLSRLAISGVENFRDFPAGPLAEIPDFGDAPRTRMGRGALKIEVEPAQGVRVRLVNAHLKSKLLTYPRPGGLSSFQPASEDERAFAAGIAAMRRSAEAVTIRAFLNTAMQVEPETHTIVLGDMNDEPLAASTLILLGAPDKDAKSDDQFDSTRLFNLVDSIPLFGTKAHEFLTETERVTRIHEGRNEIIDHLMVSKRLLLSGSDWAVTEVRSFANLIEGQSVSGNANERIGEEASDHAPVLARFEVD